MKNPFNTLRLRTKWILSILAVFLVGLSLRGCFRSDIEQQATGVLPSVTVQPIEPGLLRRFSVTGEVEAEKYANFQADFTSTVQEIFVRVGDTVSQGQQLLILQAPEVSQQLTTANAVYTTTAQGLAQTRITAQQNVEDAKIAVKTAQINLEKLLQENAARKRQAEQTLQSATLNLELSSDLKETALQNTINSTQTTVRQALVLADELLEYSPVQAGLTYVKETHLGVRDPTQKRNTVDALNEAYRALQSFTPSYSNALALLADTESALQMLVTTLFNSVTSPQYTQDTLNSNIDAVNAQLSAVRALKSSLQTAKSDLDQTRRQAGGTSQVIIDAQAQYETTIAQLEAQEQKARLEVERASNALESAIASARASEISAISSVTSARGQLDQAQISSDKLAIIAPFDGVVTQMPVRIGRKVQVGELVAAVENASWLKVVAYVSAEEVRYITAGEVATIDDAYTATVDSVAPSADPQSKKYKVELRMASGALLPGEFVQVTLKGERTIEDNRIFLPVSAVHVTAAQTFVWIAWEEDGVTVAHKQPVTLGDLSGKYIEIRSGIELGDRVIIQGGRALSTDGQQISVAEIL